MATSPLITLPADGSWISIAPVGYGSCGVQHVSGVAIITSSPAAPVGSVSGVVMTGGSREDMATSDTTEALWARSAADGHIATLGVVL